MPRTPSPPPRIDRKAVGRRIKTRRVAMGLTMAMLSQAEGVSGTEAMVCGWESGRALPKLSRLPSLARALGITVQELLWGPKAPPMPESPDHLPEPLNLFWAMVGSDLAGLILSEQALNDLRRSWENALMVARRRGEESELSGPLLPLEGLRQPTLGRHLRVARSLARLTQAQLADRIQVTKAKIQAIECGRNKGAIVLVRRWLAACSVAEGWTPPEGFEDDPRIGLGGSCWPKPR